MMKQKNQTLLFYITIMLVIILIIVYIFYKKSGAKSIENFINYDSVLIDSNFYDLTQESSVFSSKPSSRDPNFNVGAGNLCIYKENRNKVDDIECISFGQIKNAIILPDFRKKTLCIDEECITIDDVLILSGKKDFKLANSIKKKPDKDNWEKTKCVKYVDMEAKTCLEKSIEGNIPTLGHNLCSDEVNNRFIMDNSSFSIDLARDYTPGFSGHSYYGGSGGGDGNVQITHEQ